MCASIRTWLMVAFVALFSVACSQKEAAERGNPQKPKLPSLQKPGSVAWRPTLP